MPTVKILIVPLLSGLLAALIAISLSLYGMLTIPNATPLTLRSFLLVIVIAGGVWCLIVGTISMALVLVTFAVLKIINSSKG